MATANCSVCRDLLENFVVSTSHYMWVAARLEAAVNKVADGTVISSLNRVVDASAIARREAVDQYRIHLLAHEARASAATALV